MTRHHRRKSIKKSRRGSVRQPWPHKRGEVPDTPRAEGRNGDHEPGAIKDARVTHGARSESPHGWRGGEGGWVGVPRVAHVGGHERTRASAEGERGGAATDEVRHAARSTPTIVGRSLSLTRGMSSICISPGNIARTTLHPG
mgnify:CR=1 FL=1